MMLLLNTPERTWLEVMAPALPLPGVPVPTCILVSSAPISKGDAFESPFQALYFLGVDPWPCRQDPAPCHRLPLSLTLLPGVASTLMRYHGI